MDVGLKFFFRNQAGTAILAGKIDIDTAIEGLLSRPLKTEL